MKPFVREGEEREGEGERSMDTLLMVCVHAYGGQRLMSGPLYSPSVLVSFPVPMIQYPRKSK